MSKRSKKSEFLKALGVMFEIWKALVDAVLAKGGTDEDIRKVQTDKSLANAIADLIVGAKKAISFPITYDQSIGLGELIRRAVGEKNQEKISAFITQERFPLKGKDVRTVKVRVEPFLSEEHSEQAAERLVAAGHVLANTGDLAGFLASHPKEVEKWNWIVALSEDSRWTDPNGNVRVPYARVRAGCGFALGHFRRGFDFDNGVLVLCE